MEEILASIRSIIADDREPPAPAPKPAVGSGPQIVYSNDSLPAARVVPPTPEPLAEAATPEASISVLPTTPKVAWEKPPAPAEPVAPPVEAFAQPIEAAAQPIDEEPFVSPETDAAVTASFNALSASVAMQSSEMIESLTRDMLRPMLKNWLDDNLPSLVERLVRAEIQRVARGGR
jgi:cell pole-organizing protein PopZ